MTTIQRILYATDLSAASEPAWDEARRLGRLLGAEILLLHVVPPPPFLPIEGYVPPQMYEDLLGSARRDAQERFDRLLGSGAGSGLKTRVRLEEGPPARRILEVATQEAADILVVGTHGRTGLERLVLGSVADRMVRQATCPVLTARSTPEGARRAEIHRICYATDFSPTARAAWPWVVALAGATGATVDLVHATFNAREPGPADGLMAHGPCTRHHGPAARRMWTRKVRITGEPAESPGRSPLPPTTSRTWREAQASGRRPRSPPRVPGSPRPRSVPWRCRSRGRDG